MIVNMQSLTGGSVFVGAGHYSATGVPCSFYGSTGSFSGQGGFAWVGSGNLILIGHPMALFAATLSFFGLGATFALDGESMMILLLHLILAPPPLPWFTI